MTPDIHHSPDKARIF